MYLAMESIINTKGIYRNAGIRKGFKRNIPLSFIIDRRYLSANRRKESTFYSHKKLNKNKKDKTTF